MRPLTPTPPTTWQLVFRPMLVALMLIWPALLAACSGQRPGPEIEPTMLTGEGPSGRIRAGGGAEALLAKKLLDGRLSEQDGVTRVMAGIQGHDSEGAPEEELEESEAVGFGGSAGGAYGGRGPGDSVPSPPTAAGPAGPATPSPGRPAMDPVLEIDDVRSGPVRAVRREMERSAGADGPSTSTRRWQRSSKAPRFARVHVGDGNSLELRRTRVTVRIEGARARTLVDHIFFNPHDRRLEGTFEYPLPTGASPVYYGMFLGPKQEQAPAFFSDAAIQGMGPERLVALGPDAAVQVMQQGDTGWGELREARVVGRMKARQVYEEIVRKQVDPALLEWESGNTFRGRVFPIEPGSFHRVVVAYEQPVDGMADGSLEYRFPLPGISMELCDVTVQGVGAEILAASPARAAVLNDVTRRWTWESGAVPSDDLVVRYAPKGDGNPKRVQAIAGRDRDGVQAFHLRYAPELSDLEGSRWADRAVFLLDTSMSEQPDRFRANVALWRRILEVDPEIRWFQVMTFDVGTGWPMAGGWLPNDGSTRQAMESALDNVVLSGGTDMGAAVDALADARFAAGSERAYLFVLTDGQITWGDRDVESLASAALSAPAFDFRSFCYRTGLGAENLALFQALTRTGGAITNVFTEGAIEAAAKAHLRPALRIADIQVVDAAGNPVPELLVAGRQAALYPGGELLLAGQAPSLEGLRLVLRGDIQGEAVVREVPIHFSVVDGQLAPRAFAELLVHQILELRRPDLEPLAVAYAQKWRIASRVSSFLVLETDAEYEQYGIDDEARSAEVGRGGVAQWVKGLHRQRTGPASPAQVLKDFVRQQLGESVAEAEFVTQLLQSLEDRDCDFGQGLNPGLPTRVDSRSEVDEALKAAMQAYLGSGDRKVQPYLAASDVALAKGAQGVALRALSCIAELHPGRTDGLRTVGYRLLAADLPEAACVVFDAVRRQRPFEPQAWRDLGRALGRAGRFQLAALCHEIVLAGTWDSRFGAHLVTVVRSEYLHLLRRGLASGQLLGDRAVWFGERIEQLAKDESAADFRVTISWNTDGTDVDLWVVEPTGEACGYNHKETKSGGRLLDDLTGGFGPERYQIETAPVGPFHVLVHLYSANDNLLSQETQVEVVVTVDAGASTEESMAFTVPLDMERRAVEVCVVDPKGGSADMGQGSMENLPEGINKSDSRTPIESGEQAPLGGPR